uniref:Tyr recombinase domain-containing protein n=1 Tax=Chromera velia CCMP2878 TaxID=1169474 RepID=A0A0G4HI95_9ALVE|eukprot:Cvel_27758.t1-p1 / transcript=Cvel_27758.t1 / gene=Cvel_27758 / organism=Chromera_velia_CCMP2878 / gene_product=hypothetical protein / transcript_product=hypothetical protein / location=Cvel_scaffold3518:610-5193(-) / protein_length=828 / sequence_SO=supercontig / SO=protein_coding / is_pseudo=false
MQGQLRGRARTLSQKAKQAGFLSQRELALASDNKPDPTPKDELAKVAEEIEVAALEASTKRRYEAALRKLERSNPFLLPMRCALDMKMGFAHLKGLKGNEIGTLRGAVRWWHHMHRHEQPPFESDSLRYFFTGLCKLADNSVKTKERLSKEEVLKLIEYWEGQGSVTLDTLRNIAITVLAFFLAKRIGEILARGREDFILRDKAKPPFVGCYIHRSKGDRWGRGTMCPIPLVGTDGTALGQRILEFLEKALKSGTLFRATDAYGHRWAERPLTREAWQKALRKAITKCLPERECTDFTTHSLRRIREREAPSSEEKETRRCAVRMFEREVKIDMGGGKTRSEKAVSFLISPFDGGREEETASLSSEGRLLTFCVAGVGVPIMESSACELSSFYKTGKIQKKKGSGSGMLEVDETEVREEEEEVGRFRLDDGLIAWESVVLLSASETLTSSVEFAEFCLAKPQTGPRYTADGRISVAALKKRQSSGTPLTFSDKIRDLERRIAAVKKQSGAKGKEPVEVKRLKKMKRTFEDWRERILESGLSQITFMGVGVKEEEEDPEPSVQVPPLLREPLRLSCTDEELVRYLGRVGNLWSKTVCKFEETVGGSGKRRGKDDGNVFVGLFKGFGGFLSNKNKESEPGEGSGESQLSAFLLCALASLYSLEEMKGRDGSLLETPRFVQKSNSVGDLVFRGGRVEKEKGGVTPIDWRLRLPLPVSTKGRETDLRCPGRAESAGLWFQSVLSSCFEEREGIAIAEQLLGCKGIPSLRPDLYQDLPIELPRDELPRDPDEPIFWQTSFPDSPEMRRFLSSFLEVLAKRKVKFVDPFLPQHR